MLHASGVLKMLLYAIPNSITILNYHRIDDPYRPDLDTYKPNISATPQGFLRQMHYVQRHFHVMSCGQLAGWLRGECELPARAAVITFDDGYCDNLTNAYPVLRKLGLPATIFLCTDYIGRAVPFYWDFAWYCFAHAPKNEPELPLMGSLTWPNAAARDLVAREWIERAKYLPENERPGALQALARSLNVEPPSDAFMGLYLDWNQVRELSDKGIEMGSHTAKHPILSRVPLDRVRQEVIESSKRIEAEIGKRVLGLAYPNGGARDFSPEVARLLPETGIEVAFTLVTGPTTRAEAKSAPLAIRRISIGHSESFPRIAAKLAGYGRLKEVLRASPSG